MVMAKPATAASSWTLHHHFCDAPKIFDGQKQFFRYFSGNFRFQRQNVKTLTLVRGQHWRKSPRDAAVSLL